MSDDNAPEGPQVITRKHRDAVDALRRSNAILAVALLAVVVVAALYVALDQRGENADKAVTNCRSKLTNEIFQADGSVTGSIADIVIGLAVRSGAVAADDKDVSVPEAVEALRDSRADQTAATDARAAYDKDTSQPCPI